MYKKVSKKEKKQKKDNTKDSNNKKKEEIYNQEELVNKVKSDFFEESNLDKLPDEELVDLYKKGAKEALETMIKRYKNLILSKTLLFYLADGQEREDLLQEAYLGFLSAIRDFNKNKGNFYTFANVCIQRHIYTFVKSLNRNKHKILKGAVSLESTINKDQEFADRRLEEYLIHSKVSSNIPSVNIYLPSEEIASVNLDYKEKREKIFKILTPIEREILKYRSLGYSYKDIANKIGKSVKSVDNALQRIKRKVKLILQD